MFRRRVARARRRPGRAGPHPLLQRANDLLNAGDFQGAAQLFDDLAQRAISRNGPAAPHLLIQAGRAKILADLVPEGIETIKQAFDIFAQRNEWMRLVRARKRAVEQLQQKGLEKEASDLEGYLSDKIPDNISEQIMSGSINPVSKAIAMLPVSCPGCGGPIRSDQVEWVDEITAECPYCGKIMRK
ncbi:hypothetical protein ACFLXB_03405 [Chloroflexota bacterium]